MKETTVDLSVWNCQVYAIWDCTASDAADVFKKNGVDMDVIDQIAGSTSDGMTLFPDSGAPIIWVRCGLDSIPGISVLCHEAVHAANDILIGRGLNHTLETEEAFAYTVENIVRETLYANKGDDNGDSSAD